MKFTVFSTACSAALTATSNISPSVSLQSRTSNFSTIARFLCLGLVLSASLFLSGCATSRYEKAPGLSFAQEPTAEQGLVVARLIDTETTFFQFNQIILAPENINEDKESKYQKLTILKPMQDGNSLFTGILKPGRYSIQSYGYQYFLGYWISDFSSVGVSFGTFEVKAGQVTDLGTFIHYSKPSDDVFINTLTRAPNPEVGEVLAKHYSFYKFDTENLLTWDEDDSAEEHESLYVSMAQNPNNFTEISKTQDDHIYFLSPLGVMLIRDHEGEWDMDAVDSNMFLTAIDKSPDGSVLTGGYEGTFFYKPAEGDWIDVSMAPEWTVDLIEFRSANEAIIVRHNRNDVLVELATIQGDAVQLKELNRYEGRGNGWQHFEKNAQEAAVKDAKEAEKLNYRIKDVNAFEFEGRWNLGIKVASQSNYLLLAESTNLTFDYDKTTNVAKTKKFDKRIDYVVATGGRLIGVDKPGTWSWSGKYEFYSYQEKTKTWELIEKKVQWCGDHEILATEEKRCESGAKVKSSDFWTIGSLVKTPNDDTFAIGVISDFKSDNDESYSHIRLLKSSDNGKTWKDSKATFPNKVCFHLVPQVTDRLLLSCESYSSDFYESTDEGKTWQHVRQQEAF